jgi:peroxiredoxin
MPSPPRVGQPLPPFALPDASGAVTRLLTYRQRQPVVVALLHEPSCPDCRVWLSALAPQRARLDELHVAALVVLPSELPTLRALALDLPAAPLVTLLADEQRNTAARYGLAATANRERPRVGVFAANRYGYLLEAWICDEANGLPPLDAALDRISFAEMADCGCGLPAWAPELIDDA